MVPDKATICIGVAGSDKDDSRLMFSRALKKWAELHSVDIYKQMYIKHKKSKRPEPVRLRLEDNW